MKSQHKKPPQVKLPRPSLPRGGTTRSGFRKLIDKATRRGIGKFMGY
jgi:hypothetical protein